MITIRTLDNGDWAFGKDGNLSVITDTSALSQAIEEYVKTLHGELIFYTDKGIRWGQILGYDVNASLVEGYIRTRIEECEGVIRVDSLTVTIQANTLSYVADIQTIYGEAQINGGI